MARAQQETAVDDKVDMVQLASGYDMPQLGLGTFQSYVKDEQVGNVAEAVRSAIKAGIRLIDCAG